MASVNEDYREVGFAPGADERSNDSGGKEQTINMNILKIVEVSGLKLAFKKSIAPYFRKCYNLHEYPL
ncbi:MAG: hypothetical protein HFH93_15595 [Lachnospiraceae bacterium]|nr:hypothetical protein [Lachnospiraceae bacterium]